ADRLAEQFRLFLGAVGGVDVEILREDVDRRARDREAEAFRDEGHRILLAAAAAWLGGEPRELAVDARRLVEAAQHLGGARRHPARPAGVRRDAPAHEIRKFAAVIERR